MQAPQMTSVIMVTYHTGPVLDKAIASVLAQTATVELVLVNNGNPPDVEAKLIERFKDEPLVRVLTGHGNIGFAKASNLGARMAQGDHLLILNPDCVLPPDAVSNLYKAMQGLKHPFMLGAKLVTGKGREQRGCRRALLTPRSAVVDALNLGSYFPRHRLDLTGDPMPKKIEPIGAISSAFMFMPKEEFRRMKGFDEAYFLHVEDLDFCLRFTQAGGHIYFVPQITAIHVGATSKVPRRVVERHKTRGLIHYFHHNFSHLYPQPLLWLLDLMVLARQGIVSLIGR